MSQIRASQIRASQIRASQISATEISSNHHEHHGAIFFCRWQTARGTGTPGSADADSLLSLVQGPRSHVRRGRGALEKPFHCPRFRRRETTGCRSDHKPGFFQSPEHHSSCTAQVFFFIPNPCIFSRLFCNEEHGPTHAALKISPPGSAL